MGQFAVFHNSPIPSFRGAAAQNCRFCTFSACYIGDAADHFFALLLLFSIQCASKFVNTVYWACRFLPSAWRIAQPRSGFFVWFASRYTKSAIPADDMGRKIAEFDSNDRFCPLNLRNFCPIMDLSKAKRRCGRSSARADRSTVSQRKRRKRKRIRKNKEAQTP